MSNEESFFREVDEDYRREQITKFFQRYAAYLLGAAFIIVAVVAGYSIEKWRRAEQAAQGGDALTNALTLSEAGKQDDARKALSSLSESGPAAYRFLARLHLAADLCKKTAGRREGDVPQRCGRRISPIRFERFCEAAACGAFGG